MKVSVGSCMSEKLRNANDTFRHLKWSSRTQLLRYSIKLCGSCVMPMSKFLLCNRVCSVGITNIAGEEEGFSILGKECTDFVLSVDEFSGLGELFDNFSK